MMDRAEMIKVLSRQVTHRSDPPYAELESALGALIDRIRDDGDSSDPVDWPVVVEEALNLRPKHG